MEKSRLLGAVCATTAIKKNSYMRRSKAHRLCAIVLVLFFSLLGAPINYALTVTAINSALQLDVWADVDGGAGPPAPPDFVGGPILRTDDSSRVTQANTINPLNVSVQAISSVDISISESTGTASVIWSSHSSGSVILDWSVSNMGLRGFVWVDIGISG